MDHSVLPAVPPALVDRPLVEAKVQAAVLAGTSSPVIVWGMAGSGKSILVARLARAAQDGRNSQLAAAFLDGVAWVQVGRARPITAVQLDLARALGEDEPDLATDWRAARTRLRQLAAGWRGLVVLDDVWSLDLYEPFRLDVAGVRVLVITRNELLSSHIQGTAIRVGELELGESRALLATAAGTSVGKLPGEADGVLQELGYLALGVTMIGAVVKAHGSQAWARLLYRLQNQRLGKVAQPFQDHKDAALLRAIDVAVDDVSLEDQQRWAELAIFVGQGPVPAAALVTMWAG